MDLPIYELFAIRYASRSAQRRDNFIGGDPHEGAMPLDYFLWVAISPERTVVVDAGFTAAISAKRKRSYLHDPIEVLGRLGVDASMVKDVVLTHLHYDHVGNFDRFPAAEFHLQEPEMHYATGRYMRFSRMSNSFEVEDVCGIVRLNYAGRVRFYNGPAELTPGITLHPVGGHSAGLQFVRVHTRRGWVVLASDVSHFYENMDSDRPYRTALHVGQMHEGFEALFAAAPTRSHIVPGHDPLVMQRYPSASAELDGIVVRLDVEPAA